MRVLILGSRGQDGHYLTEHCKARGDEVLGLSRTTHPLACDVGDLAQVESAVRSFAPDQVYLLAARSSTREGLYAEHQRTIVEGTRHLLSTIEQLRPQARVFVAGSALQFENHGAPIDETTLFAASSSYALARIMATWTARYFRSRGLAVRVGFLFHHESPLRPAAHIAQHVATVARRIAAGSRERLALGAPEVAREWTFAGDVARAMTRGLEQDHEDEVVIGSGEAHTLGEWAASCFLACGLDWREHTDVLSGYTPEYEKLVSNPSRLLGLGWRKAVELEELAHRMVSSGLSPAFA